MTHDSISPLRTLHGHAEKLDAALAAFPDDPAPKAVHELRTRIRRIEAQLDLLRMVGQLTTRDPRVVELERRLTKLRRAAGGVRDVDVQQQMLEKHRAGLENDQDGEQGEQKNIAKEIGQLQGTLGKRRKRAVGRLMHSIERQRPKLEVTWEPLWESLGEQTESQTQSMTAAEALPLVRERLQKAIEHEKRHPKTKRLHALRKVAKKARYQAEGLAGFAGRGRVASGSAAAEAARYEALQDAGGAWHDLVNLQKTAARKLGRKHALTRHLEEACEASGAEYRRLLEEERAAPEEDARVVARKARGDRPKRCGPVAVTMPQRSGSLRVA